VSSAPHKLKLNLLPDVLAVCRLAPGDAVPAWAAGQGLVSVTRTADELSIVAPRERVPDGVTAQRDFRALRVAGSLDFGAVGVLASLVGPLAAAGVSIFSISTYDTDYILVRQSDLDRAIAALKSAGHTVERT